MEPRTEIVALFVPIVSVIVVGLVVIAFFYFRFRARNALQETIQQALDKGAELTPDLLERLAGARPGPDADLRKGLIWTAVGLGSICFGILIPDDEATGAMAGIGMFPFLIGVAYFVMWKFAGRKDTGD